ncbi:uncharacterized protein MELLADRAFT_103458 [Melampsora larici-populina 98AG31]|uniref:Uncharacterized protein n=1 Tax=Melampsora larici-populina (strain 98AG31 / pathotype 3-4-7) TaxID=747676 RepID=F4RBI6_MELLP|nr:uncharacterized protein MELLADRAFT_103458 [Melampsora larici-populina 98AG31]EGG10092.1 hypothetical protein MELLADRAFT_103458 [Melampsora larici-populina 98AG31]
MATVPSVASKDINSNQKDIPWLRCLQLYKPTESSAVILSAISKATSESKSPHTTSEDAQLSSSVSNNDRRKGGDVITSHPDDERQEAVVPKPLPKGYAMAPVTSAAPKDISSKIDPANVILDDGGRVTRSR